MGRWLGKLLTKLNKLALIGILAFSFVVLSPFEAMAQSKGISFQAVLKKPDGTYPTVSGLSVTLQVLDPVNDCVLREELHSGVNIADGYINLVLGSAAASTPGGRNPSPVLTIAQVMDNTTPRTGLNCVDTNNNVTSTGQSYTPSESHPRKLRLRAVIGGDTIVADFKMRAVAFAVDAENLGGKAASGFVQTSAATTQANVESIFGRYATLDGILNGTFAGNAATATALAAAPGACPAGQYLTAMSASGTITCGTPAGNVTEVTSANAYLTVATGTTTPALTLNVGTAANTVAAGDDARFTDSRPPNGTAGGDLSGTYPNPTVAKVSGKTVTLTSPAAGDVLTYDGSKFVNSPGADGTKLPLAGGTMSGSVDYASNNLTNLGYVTMSAGKSLHLSNNTSDPTGLGSADKGKLWFNTTTGQVTYWDGTAAQPLASTAASSALADGKIMIGNSSNVATAQTMSGDATISNAGVVTLGTVPISKGGTGLTSFSPNVLVTTDGVGALRTSSCSLNQVISFTAGGAITCADVSTLAPSFLNGGNSFGAAASIGTNDAKDLTIKTSNTARVTVLAGGNVGIGVPAPTAKLQVQGQIISAPYNNGSATTFDFANGNAQYTTASCGAMTLQNMVDGGSYTLAIQGATSGTCTFTDSAGGRTFKFAPANAATVANTHSVYSMQVMGTYVYVSWITGF